MFAQQVLDSLAEQVAVIGRDGRILAVNAAWEEFARANGSATTPGAWVGADYLAVTRAAAGAGDQVAARALADLEQILAGATAEFALEYPCHSPETERWFALQARALAAGGAVVVSHREITAARAHAEALAARTRQLQALRDVTADMTRELDLDRLLRLIVERATALGRSASGSIFLWEAEAGELVERLSVGMPAWYGGVRRRPGEGLAGSVAASRGGLTVNDLRESPLIPPQILAQTEFRRVMAEPMLYHDRLVGVLVLRRGGDSPLFEPADADLLRLFAGQAAIAVENARLFAEAGEYRREAERLGELAHRIGASLDTETVLRSIAEAAREITRSDMAQLAFREEAGQALICRHWVGARSPAPPAIRVEPGVGFLGHVLATGAPFRTDDYPADPRFDKQLRSVAAAEGTVAELGVPILLQGRVEGILAAVNRSARPFTARDEARLLRLADRAATAIQNARLHKSLGAQVERLDLLNNLTNRLVTLLEPERLLESVTEAVRTIYPGAAIRIWVRDAAEPELLSLAASAGLRDPRGGARLRIRVGEGILGQAAAEQVPLTSLDVRQDPRFVNRAWAEAEGLVAMIACPMVFGEHTYGVLTVSTRHPHEFSLAEVALFQSLAGHAAFGLENARLYREIQAHALELEERVRERTAALERALQVKSDFLARMSHELRTPLNAVLGFSELLREGIAGPLTERQGKYVDRIQTGGKALLELLNALLDLSVDARERGPMELEPVALVPLVREAALRIGDPAGRKGLRIQTEVEEGLMVVADRRRLGQILEILLGNAVKFTPPGGRIAVTARRIAGGSLQTAALGGAEAAAGSGDIAECGMGNGESRTESAPGAPPSALPSVPAAACGLPAAASASADSAIRNPQSAIEIAVEDSGIGIAPEDRERIFEGFVQMESVLTRTHGGAGVGLALARKLVRLHGGRIWAESPGPGRGARFLVRLPGQAPRTDPGPVGA